MKRYIVVCALLVSSGCGTPSETAVQPIPGTSSPRAATTVAREAPPSTATTTSTPPSVPWLEPALPQRDVPEILIEQWLAADNSEWCSALFPENADVLGEEASIRSASFGGGWAVSWDLPDGPGRFADGGYCPDCGRSAYGVAGAGVLASGNEADRWPTRIAYDDGSVAGYGNEGDAPAGSGAPLLAYLLIKGEGCNYNVWSFLGEAHLLDLLSRLRLVEGLQGQPTQWLSELPEPDIVALGDPPWADEALDDDLVPEIAHEEWAESGSRQSCPMLYFADLGDADGASIRHAANEGQMLVAWDLPDGPGHEGDSSPCEDCGRGVVGLGTFDHESFDGPVAYTWADGSEARLRTGPYSYGIEAFVRVEGFGCDYWMWTHLGQEHLEYLFTQLRLVDGSP